MRKQAYLGVRVRVGNDTFYEFRINPKEKKYKLNRDALRRRLGPSHLRRLEPDQPARREEQAPPPDHRRDVTAFVNGNSIETYDDPNPGQVTGRKVAFGVGSTKEANNGPVGVFKSIKVGVPTP